MEGKKIEIFLKTPLFRFKYMIDGEEKHLMENAVRISGEVIKEKSHGLTINVEGISNLKISETSLPFREIFIPFSKVDYIIVK